MTAILAAGAALGCASAGGEPTAEPPKMTLPMVERRPDTLLLLIRPSGSEPLPEGFSHAQALFEAAEKDYEATRYAAAAQGFLAAAKALRLSGPYQATFEADRRVSYQNAASAFEAARDVLGARAAFTTAIGEDPACADTLRAILDELAEPPEGE